jgi:hypothetical protein
MMRLRWSIVYGSRPADFEPWRAGLLLMGLLVAALILVTAACAPRRGGDVGADATSTALATPAVTVERRTPDSLESAAPAATPSVAVTEIIARPSAEPTVSGQASAGDYIGVTVEGGAIGQIYQLMDVRTGEHDGFTRIVWELDRKGDAPLFKAVQLEGSVDSMPGSAHIEVVLHDVHAFLIPEIPEIDATDSPAVVGVRHATIYDDSLMGWNVALDSPSVFEIRALVSDSAPTRIVLDVYH